MDGLNLGDDGNNGREELHIEKLQIDSSSSSKNRYSRLNFGMVMTDPERREIPQPPIWKDYPMVQTQVNHSSYPSSYKSYHSGTTGSVFDSLRPRAPPLALLPTSFGEPGFRNYHKNYRSSPVADIFGGGGGGLGGRRQTPSPVLSPPKLGPCYNGFGVMQGGSSMFGFEGSSTRRPTRFSAETSTFGIYYQSAESSTDLYSTRRFCESPISRSSSQSSGFVSQVGNEQPNEFTNGLQSFYGSGSYSNPNGPYSPPSSSSSWLNSHHRRSSLVIPESSRRSENPTLRKRAPQTQSLFFDPVPEDRIMDSFHNRTNENVDKLDNESSASFKTCLTSLLPKSKPNSYPSKVHSSSSYAAELTPRKIMTKRNSVLKKSPFVEHSQTQSQKDETGFGTKIFRHFAFGLSLLFNVMLLVWLFFGNVKEDLDYFREVLHVQGSNLLFYIDCILEEVYGFGSSVGQIVQGQIEWAHDYFDNENETVTM